ncbi:MAG TPA: NPCBM/NEW2 domain-containing protein [Hanamia sp.]
MRKLLLLYITFLPLTSFTKTVWLNDLDLSRMLQDWGSPQVNKSVLGATLQVAGIKYQQGVGTHSVSRFLVNLGGMAISFSGLVGADDNNDFAGNMEFRLIADKKLIWASGILHKGMQAVPFKVNLNGVQKLALLVVEGGDGIMYDHADWLDAKFVTSGMVIPEPVMPKKLEISKYILTPKVSDKPKINGAKVLGVHPQSPVLFKIPTTGKKPIFFSSIHLPNGLILDKKRGIITGSVNRAGTYNVILKAENEMGYSIRILRIEVGKNISLTPPMGWNSWNCWGLEINEQKVKEAADYMSKNLSNHGWCYINIDDGWEAKERDPDGQLPGNQKFPDFKRLCDYVHSKGLKFGIYSSPGTKTCGGHLGSYHHEEIDAKTWAGWGVDYLKYDYCYYSQIVPFPTEELIKKPYALMRKALDSVHRDIVYCIGFGAPNVWNWGQKVGGNQWRTTRDITDQWNIVSSIGFFQDVCAPVIKPGNYNDPDMLVVGKLGLGWGKKVHDSYLTADEQYSHVSLWCLQSAPLLIGCDMAKMDSFTLNLLTNDEVIAVDQDPLVFPSKKILTDNGQIWYKYLDDGSIAVGFFNADPYYILWNKNESEKVQRDKYKMSLHFSDLNLKGKFKVRDLWRQKDLGVFENKFTTDVAYHGVTLVKITPEK